MSERNKRLQAAVDAVASKQLSLQQAAERFNVPKSTIRDHSSCGFDQDWGRKTNSAYRAGRKERS